MRDDVDLVALIAGILLAPTFSPRIAQGWERSEKAIEEAMEIVARTKDRMGARTIQPFSKWSKEE